MGTHPSALQAQLGLGVVACPCPCPPPKAGRLCPEGHTSPGLTLPEELNVPRAPGVFVTEHSRDQDELLPPLHMDTDCGKPFTPPTQAAGEGRKGPHLLRANTAHPFLTPKTPQEERKDSVFYTPSVQHTPLPQAPPDSPLAHIWDRNSVPALGSTEKLRKAPTHPIQTHPALAPAPCPYPALLQGFFLGIKLTVCQMLPCRSEY